MTLPVNTQLSGKSKYNTLLKTNPRQINFAEYEAVDEPEKHGDIKFMLLTYRSRSMPWNLRFVEADDDTDEMNSSYVCMYVEGGARNPALAPRPSMIYCASPIVNRLLILHFE
jgi:hypothetical protein